MRELSVGEMKEVELTILISIDEICRANNIRYSLAYGTLLGAVRHKGFIPWDDDIDLIMTRSDYIKFLAYCRSNETTFRLEAYEFDNKYAYTYAKACDRNTVVVEHFSNRNNAELGVYIDIFPIDALPGDYKKALRVFKAKEFERDLIVAYNWKRYSRSKTGSLLKEPFRFAFYLLSRVINVERIIKNVEKYYLQNDWNAFDYAGNVVDGTWGRKNVMPIKVFCSYTDIEFESKYFMCIKDFDVFLSSIYGEYMTLPPVEKRVTHHSFSAYWKNDPD